MRWAPAGWLAGALTCRFGTTARPSGCARALLGRAGHGRWLHSALQRSSHPPISNARSRPADCRGHEIALTAFRSDGGCGHRQRGRTRCAAWRASIGLSHRRRAQHQQLSARGPGGRAPAAALGDRATNSRGISRRQQWRGPLVRKDQRNGRLDAGLATQASHEARRRAPDIARHRIRDRGRCA